jgi:hypothetical protein
MIENIAYVIMGFAATYLSLEVAWHFTAWRLKPCVFKQMKNGLDGHLKQASPGRVM